MQLLQTDSAGPHSAGKLECFESIRGLAAFAVVVAHLLCGFWPAMYSRNGPWWQDVPGWLQLLARFPGKYLWNGETAVTIFFVLSGFVLSLSFFLGGSAQALASAAVRRYPRLMLPAAASVLFAFLLLQAGASRSQEAVRFMDETQGLSCEPDAPPGHSNNWLRGFYNFSPDLLLALRQGTWDAFVQGANYNLVLWTMPVELAGSFLVFAFLALFGRLRNRWLLYALCGTVLLVQRHEFMFDFLIGMAASDLWAHNRRTWRRSLMLTPAVVLLAAGLFVVRWKPLTALMVVAVTAAAPRVQQFLSLRWLTFLGKISFALYLVHMPIFCSLGCGLFLVFCRDLGWSYIAGTLAAGAASTLASFIAAWAFYHWVDRPAIALTRWLETRLFRPKAGPENAVVAMPPSVPLARAA
jgi:peptidoglycan/LPS O-acetylase OafA/YrhL